MTEATLVSIWAEKFRALGDRIKKEPSLVTGVLRTLLAALVGAGVVHLTTEQSGAVLAVVAGGVSLLLAISVRPFAWPLLTGLYQAGLALALSFGAHLDQSQLGTVLAAVAALSAILDRQQVTPETKLTPTA